ncbi:MAG: hypothetical protein ACP5TI_02785 [Thermoprotei archaeon]
MPIACGLPASPEPIAVVLALTGVKREAASRGGVVHRAVLEATFG